MVFHEKRTLGSTALTAGRLGISSSFGAPASAFEEAFDHGCNYFTWGTFIKGRSKEMAKAIQNIKSRGMRDDLILSSFTYAHEPLVTDFLLRRGLKSVGLDYVDILLLGYFSRRPSERILEGALRLKQQGLVRFIGVSGHNRGVFPGLAGEGLFDVFHLRYNAAHRGAETDIFPRLSGNGRPGIVAFTATRWGNLSNPKKMPEGEPPLTPQECYRFVLSHPDVDICMMGAKNREEMRQNLKVLESSPISEEERSRICRIGDHIHK